MALSLLGPIAGKTTSTGQTKLSHFFFGAVGCWPYHKLYGVYKVMVGSWVDWFMGGRKIRAPGGCGRKCVLISAQFGKCVKKLMFFLHNFDFGSQKYQKVAHFGSILGAKSHQNGHWGALGASWGALGAILGAPGSHSAPRDEKDRKRDFEYRPFGSQNGPQNGPKIDKKSIQI